MNVEKVILVGIGLCCFSYVLTSIVRALIDKEVCTRCKCNKGDLIKKVEDGDNGGQPKE
jgi:hypothetical protein